jgi:hypothetical protein
MAMMRRAVGPISALIQGSDEARALAKALAQWLLTQASLPSSAPPAPPPAPPSSPVSLPVFALMSMAESRPAARPANSIVETKQQPSNASRATHASQPPLRLIAKRCRLKAEACELHVRIRREPNSGRFGLGPTLKPAFDSLIANAKELPQCYLWVFSKAERQPPDDRLQVIADAYRALADAADLVQSLEVAARPKCPYMPDAINALAEAQSAVRVALLETWLTKADDDQHDAFEWLRDKALSQQWYIPRFMRLDDLADPLLAKDLQARVGAIGAADRADTQRRKTERLLLERIRYHRSKIDKSAGTEGEHDFSVIASAVAELIAAGWPPSDRRIRDALGATVVRAFPVELEVAATVRRALSYAAEAMNANTNASAAQAERDEVAPAPGGAAEWSPAVLRVRELLQGRTIVVVGGDKRNDAVGRFEDAFGATVEWVEIREHASPLPARAVIQRPGIALVLVLVRLAGHQHVSSTKGYATEARVPFVHLPRGYNPEQVAAAIIGQVGDRMGLEPRA